MKYYRFISTTPYCGTDSYDYFSFENDPTNAELEELADELCYNNANSYEYLVHGWHSDPVGDGEMTEEEYEASIENYYADCSCTWEEISQEEFEYEMYE